ncbi:MAG: hypothetical protein JWM31_2164, partial [Solirubrobacterales bacterium]|nr:hypothetical protein [Solirubrobacterales bacterium]
MAASGHPPPPARLTHRLRDGTTAILLVVLSYALALHQRTGEEIADTKLALYVAPHRFLHDVVSAWSSTSDLGHVWGGQYNGYLFPMAPWFAAGDSLGLPVWLVHRLWLGTLLALAALGVLALLRALVDRGTAGPLHGVAAVLYVVCPYTVVIVDRTSISLLAYAALPWLLLAVHRGLRDPRGLRWPAIFALVLSCTGGGVNAAVTGWVLSAPALLLVYEVLWGGVDRRDVLRWLLRLTPIALVVNLWWLLPLAVHSRYGLDFLPFTEQPGTIWSTSSLTESLRGMGFWTSYIGVGFGGTLRPYATHGSVLLFDLKVVLAGLLIPALVVLGLRWTARARYAPFFVLLILFGLLVMGVGFPEGTPLRRASTFAYNHVAVVQVLRTTYKAGPLVTLGLAALGGMAFARAWAALVARPVLLRSGFAVACAALIALAAWPLTRGTAPDEQLHVEVPARWTTLARTLQTRPDDTRALVLPGQLFASYAWGQTIDPILPSLTDHPVATRGIVPYADRRSVELQWAVDDLVSQERLVPGQLPGLLDLLGVGDVVLAADGDRTRSGELGPLEAANALRGQLGTRTRPRPVGTQTRLARPASGRLAPARRVPLLQDTRVPTGGLVRALPRGRLTVTDGGARALTGLAAFARLDPSTPYAAAADLTPAAIRAGVEDGGDVVIADGDRRQAFVSSRLRGGTGYVLPATRTVSEDGTLLDPFDDTGHGADAQTVQLLQGVEDVAAPFSPQVTQFPEHRPYAALDGDLRTSWLGERLLPIERRVLTVTLDRPQRVDRLRLYPADDARGTVTAVRVNGRRFALHRGWNALAVRLGTVDHVEVALAAVRRPRRNS